MDMIHYIHDEINIMMFDEETTKNNIDEARKDYKNFVGNLLKLEEHIGIINDNQYKAELDVVKNDMKDPNKFEIVKSEFYKIMEKVWANPSDKTKIKMWALAQCMAEATAKT
jgi:hypothetical protein